MEAPLEARFSLHSNWQKLCSRFIRLAWYTEMLELTPFVFLTLREERNSQLLMVGLE